MVLEVMRGKISIPWPTRDETLLSEFTTQCFFTLAFHVYSHTEKEIYNFNRRRTCTTFSDWMEHLLWFKDGRFAHGQYIKFVAHNNLIRNRAVDIAN